MKILDGILIFCLLFNSLSTFSNNLEESFVIQKDSFSHIEFVEIETNDSLTIFQNTLEHITQSPVFEITHLSIPLAVGSFLGRHSDEKFKALRHDYLPRFSYEYDDYLQYSPAVLLYGLKIGGIEGRSTWPRMLVSDIFSIAIMTGTVTLLKETTEVMRPDYSKKNSFPSGHTATAFMAATMLHKEYGRTRSPWYSVCGYGLAFGTGISRLLNDRHWASDVMMGAALGIFSTELGYYITDLFFKDKGLVRKNKNYDTFRKGAKPNYLGLYTGVNYLLGKKKHLFQDKIDISNGATLGLDAAYFFTPNWGVGGRISITGMIFSVNQEVQDWSMDVITLQIGPQYNCLLSPHWMIGANILGGYADIPSYNGLYLKKDRSGGFVWSVNTSSSYLMNRYFSIKGLLGYTYLPSIRAESVLGYQSITLGASLNFFF